MVFALGCFGERIGETSVTTAINWYSAQAAKYRAKRPKEPTLFHQEACLATYGGIIEFAHQKIVVAGVVSKIDTDNGIYKKAVPVTEIDYMIRKKKEEAHD